MKKLNSLSLKGLSRAEMKTVNGGIRDVNNCSFTIGSQHYSGVNTDTYLYICSSYDCTNVVGCK